MLATIFVFASTSMLFSQTTSQLEDRTTTIEVKVKGVGCSADLKSIAENVKSTEGVSDCNTIKKGATTTFEVIYNPELVTEEDIFAAIEDTPGCKSPEDRPYTVKR